MLELLLSALYITVIIVLRTVMFLYIVVTIGDWYCTEYRKNKGMLIKGIKGEYKSK